MNQDSYIGAANTLRKAITKKFGPTVSLTGLERRMSKLTLRITIDAEEKSVDFSMEELAASSPEHVREMILSRIGTELFS